MDFFEHLPQDVAELLFAKNAVKIDLENGFALKGGIHSPVFCEMPVLQSDVDARSQICGLLLFWVNRHYRDIDAVVGVASGGIGWAASLAGNKLLPLLCAHAVPKDHGMHNQIDGELPFDGAKVLVIDDTVTSGRSVLSVIKALREGKNGKKADVLGVCSVFDWDFPVVNQKFAEMGVEKMHILTFGSLLKYGVVHNLLTPDVEKRLQAFYNEHCWHPLAD
ncbi:MAG: hypothetical protein J6B00_00465 [Alphaproteobacteria bacterium]|nr:hypothetical protein [Alphaproteobacteria bacterium]MBO5441428.1 hypothetical protein [Alphaproteobacteria bacterium]